MIKIKSLIEQRIDEYQSDTVYILSLTKKEKNRKLREVRDFIKDSHSEIVDAVEYLNDLNAKLMCLAKIYGYEIPPILHRRGDELDDCSRKAVYELFYDGEEDTDENC